MKVMRYVLGVILLGLTVPSWAAAIQPMTKGAEPGVWTTDFAAALAKSEAEHIPLLSFWGYEGCGYCGLMKSKALTSPEFAAWIQAHPILLVYTEVTESQTGVMTPVKQFTKNSSGLFPYMRTYWPKADGTVAGKLFTGREDKMGIQYGTLAQKLVARLDADFGAWKPNSYAGGEFACDESVETPVHRLEVEASTRKLSVELVRSDAAAGVATNGTFKAYKPNGKDVLSTKTIKWEAGEKSQFVTIDLPANLFHSTNEVMKLEMVQGSEVKSTAHVYYVDAPVSAGNPKWVGEPESFNFGEWTMDIDTATNEVSKATGAAYTLVAIQGSLWCPDCANTERNFLDVKEGTTNLIEKWAKSKQVALVAMDIPNFNSPAVECESPSLLKRAPYATALARAGEFPQAGASASLTNRMLRSGLGYITRKMISEVDATNQLAKFHFLAKTNTNKGGFHRPEDGNVNRTGVPIFVLLRKDGMVAARLTRFASASPMKDDQKEFSNILKRFDEMLAIADSDESEIENNYPSDGSIPFKSNGGSANGEISHTDMRDTFYLEGVGNALQKVTVKGSTDADVEVSFVSTNSATPLKKARGKLSTGISLEYTFTDKGKYYVLVEGADITSEAFDVKSGISNHVHSFTITGDVVFVPQENRATGNAPEGKNTVVVRLEKDKIYRLDGLDITASSTYVTPENEGKFCKFFKAKVDGDCPLTLTGSSLEYQLWNPGQVNFSALEVTVTESVGSLLIPVSRVKGVSGRIVARVSLDPSTDLYDDYTHEPCFKFVQTDLVWEDGDNSTQTANLEIIDDIYFNSGRKVVTKLEVLSSDNDDATVIEGRDLYTVKVKEDDRAVPGQAMIMNADVGFAKAKTIYVKQSAGAVVNLARFDGVDGMVAIDVTASLNTVRLSAGPGNEDFWNLGDEFENVAGYWGWQYWKGRDGAIKPIKVSNLPAPGKSFKIKLAQILNKEYLGYDFKPYVASNSITIVSVSDAGLEFATPKDEIELGRYVEFEGAVCPLKTVPSGRVTFTKLSGTLPAGLKVSYDKGQNALLVTGSTTAKPGVYTAVYQVKEGSVAGLTKELVFTVYDPTNVKVSPEMANPAVAVTRTLRDLPVENESRGLVGRLTLTIPARGNVSASYVGVGGTVSFSCKSWSGFQSDTKMLSANLTSRKAGYGLQVEALANGEVHAVITDPNFEEMLFVESDGVVWSKTETAEAWKGYYTAILPVENVVAEDRSEYAPRGTGYLTMKMESKSAYQSGKVTWAGILPNGKAVSGSTTLSRDNTVAMLPVFVSNSSDLFSSFIAIEAGVTRSVQARKKYPTYWLHNESAVEALADFEVEMGVYGSLYDRTADLGGCCAEYYKENKLPFTFDSQSLTGTRYGDLGAVEPAWLDVQSATIKLSSAPKGMTLSFNRSTGVLTGKVPVPYGAAGKTFSASWKAVVLSGWGNACGCGEASETKPFISGVMTFTDKVTYEKNGRSRSVSVTRGAQGSTPNE